MESHCITSGRALPSTAYYKIVIKINPNKREYKIHIRSNEAKKYN